MPTCSDPQCPCHEDVATTNRTIEAIAALAATIPVITPESVAAETLPYTGGPAIYDAIAGRVIPPTAAPEPTDEPPQTCGSCDQDLGCDRDETPCRVCGHDPECSEHADNCSYCEGCDRWRSRDDMHGECNQCNRCCECPSCQSCDRCEPELSICSNCDECDSCCECYTCARCGSHVSDLACGDCERCDDCGCTCSTAPEDDPSERSSGGSSSPRWIAASLVFHRGKANARFPSRRYASAEIEVAGADARLHHGDTTETLSGLSYALAPDSKPWSFAVVKDGSLGSYGFEINTAPASGDLFTAQIDEVCRRLNLANARVDKSCGLHVHIDASKATAAEVMRFVRVADHLRDAVRMVVPASRHESTYARDYRGRVSSYQAISKMSPQRRFRAIAKAIYEGSVVNGHPQERLPTMADSRYWARNKYNDARYDWVNVHSWCHRGTIEIRIHSGTVNAEKITMWASYWACLMDRVSAWTDADADAFIAATPNSWAAFLRLAPSPEHARYLADRRATFDYRYTPSGDPELATLTTTKKIAFTIKASE